MRKTIIAADSWGVRLECGHIRAQSQFRKPRASGQWAHCLDCAAWTESRRENLAIYAFVRRSRPIADNDTLRGPRNHQPRLLVPQTPAPPSTIRRALQFIDASPVDLLNWQLVSDVVGNDVRVERS